MFLGESGHVGAMGGSLGGGKNEDIKAWAKGKGIEMNGGHVGFKAKTGPESREERFSSEVTVLQEESDCLGGEPSRMFRAS